MIVEALFVVTVVGVGWAVIRDFPVGGPPDPDAFGLSPAERSVYPDLHAPRGADGPPVYPCVCGRSFPFLSQLRLHEETECEETT